MRFLPLLLIAVFIAMAATRIEADDDNKDLVPIEYLDEIGNAASNRRLALSPKGVNRLNKIIKRVNKKTKKKKKKTKKSKVSKRKIVHQIDGLVNEATEKTSTLNDLKSLKTTTEVSA